MGWLDTSNPLGGMCIADQNLVDAGIVGDGSFYRYCGRQNPKDPSLGRLRVRGSDLRGVPFSDGRTVVRGGYGMFYDSAEGREIDGSADIYPYVSRGSYPQSIGQLTPLQTTDALVPGIQQPRARSRPRPTASSRSSSRRTRRTRTCSSGRSARSGR